MMDLDESGQTTHPAIEYIRSALADNSFTSGTCKVPIEQCDLYYRPTPATLASLNLARASESELAALLAACDAAPFGRGNQNVLDEAYRKAYKLDISQFALPFELAGTGIINKLEQDLVNSDVALRRAIRAEPYKLNIYDKGAFFKSHKDTPRADNMFGSLVVVFPTPHEGGTLVLREKAGGTPWHFDAGRMITEPSEIAYVAFFSDTEHEILPVTSGMRITLTYNLYFEDKGFSSDASSAGVKHAGLKNALQQLISDPEFLPKGGRMCFSFAHQYSVMESHQNEYEPKTIRPDLAVKELWKYLKGTDALIYHACQDLGLNVKLRVLYTAEYYHYDGHYPYDDRESFYEADYPMYARPPARPESPAPDPDPDYEVENSTDIRASIEGVRARGVAEDVEENTHANRSIPTVWITPVHKRDGWHQFSQGGEQMGNDAAPYSYGDVCLIVTLEV